MSYTVSPVMDDQGNYLGSEVANTSRAGSATNHNGQVVGNDFDYFEDSQGKLHHRFEDTQLMDETSPDSDGAFDHNGYFTGIIETQPELVAAASWASENQQVLPEGFIDSYNKAIELGDLETFHRLAETLLDIFPEEDWNSNNQDHETQDLEEGLKDAYQELDEWFENEVSQDYFDGQIETILNAELTPDDANELVQMADNWEHNSCEHAILSQGVDIAFGKITQHQAIENVINQFGTAHAFASYLRVVDSIPS